MKRPPSISYNKQTNNDVVSTPTKPNQQPIIINTMTQWSAAKFRYEKLVLVLYDSKIKNNCLFLAQILSKKTELVVYLMDINKKDITKSNIDFQSEIIPVFKLFNGNKNIKNITNLNYAFVVDEIRNWLE